MKCSGCGEEFPNLARLKEHKPDCSMAKPDPEAPGPFLIPLAMCPPEIQYYAAGKTVGLRVTGILTNKGVEVQEVTLIR